MTLLAAPSLALASPSLHVVGGEPAEVDAWPDVVALFSGNTFLCTGTLIAPRWVLTAAHCNWGLSSARIGAVDFTAGGEVIEVESTTTHPRYWETFDLALVKLAAPSSHPPRALALGCVLDDWLWAGASVEIVGFGSTDPFGAEGNTLLHAARARIEDPECVSAELGCLPEVSPGGELIAGGDGLDSCSGDSGGPLYLWTQDGAFVVGVTSRGLDGATQPCGEGGIYARPDAALAWIREETGLAFEGPQCSPVTNRPPAPTLAPAYLGPGESFEVTLAHGDPDPNQRWTWRMLTEPSLGLATLEPDGGLTYAAGREHHGDDTFVVEVTDDGAPPLSATLVVEVRVLPVVLARGRTGCDTGGALALPWWLLLALRRRSR